VAWYAFTRTAIAVVLLSAAVAKLASRDSVRPFLDALGVPPRLGGLIAPTLPALEAACGILLLTATGSATAVLPAAVLTTGFVGALAVAGWTGVTVSCRCFGAADAADTGPTAGPAPVLRAVVLAVVTVALALSPADRAGQLPASAVLTGALAAWVYIGVFAMFGRVWGFEHERAERVRRLRAAAAPAEGSTA
jgi:putative oxidoreductase